jgi:hypothetical protein
MVDDDPVCVSYLQQDAHMPQVTHWLRGEFRDYNEALSVLSSYWRSLEGCPTLSALGRRPGSEVAESQTAKAQQDQPSISWVLKEAGDHQTNATQQC